MSHFLFNIAITLFIFINWFFCGLGFSLFLIQPNHRRYALLLAPLIGMTLIVLIGFYKITVLLTPLTPYLDVIILESISLLLCLWIKYRHSFSLNRYTLNQLAWLCIPSFLILLSIAWLFHHEGFQLMLGGSDQLQYCLNAKQMLEEMHTGSLNDTPVMRHDYIIYDIATRILPYFKTYRRGAEVLLANTTALSGLSYQKAFSLTILCSLMTLGFILGYIGRFFLYFSRSVTFLLQIVFLSSFFLCLEHVQGCLALILSLGPYFAALALLTQLAHKTTWKLFILTSLLIAGYFSIYAEPALVNIILPSVLLIIWNLYRGLVFKSGRKRNLCNSVVLVFLYLVVLVCAPYAMYSVYKNFSGNFDVVLTYLKSLKLSIPSSNSSAAFQQWTVAAVVFGVSSYFDDTFSKIAYYVGTSATLCSIGFFFLVAFACWGFLQTKHFFHRLLFFPFVIWASFAPLMVYQQDGVRFIRSLEYAIPFIIIGIFLLTFRGRLNKLNRSYNYTRWTGLFLLTIFTFTNIYTDARSFKYLATHNSKNDHLILRFEENNRLWRSLREELSMSARRNKPILISGYKETIRPLALVSDFPSQPHVLGTSILTFWSLYNYRARFPAKYYNTRLSSEAVEAGLEYEDKFWSKHPEIPMIKESEQAIVPNDGGYPVEWLDTKDVYAPRTKRFTNIGDVVYRKDFGAVLKSNMTGRLKKDNHGIFRVLAKSGPIIIKNANKGTQPLTIEFSGNINDVKLRIGNRICHGTLASKSLVRITENIHPDEINQLSLIIVHPVKLRSMSWIML